MLIIGERINGMFKNVREAIQSKDKGAIQDLARRQVEAGASMLDVNVGPASDQPQEAMVWLVETIQEAVDVPLSLDSANLDVVRVGLEAREGRKSLINSTTGHQEKLDQYFPLAKEYNASLIGLTIDESGVPSTVDGRVEIAMKILAAALEHEFPLEELYIDPIVLPVNVAQDQCPHILQALSQFQILSDPPPHTVVGLSNVSQRCQERSLINRTYLVMCMAHGLDAAIVDPLDKNLMDAMITAELLLNKNIYCDSFLEAYRKSMAAG
ncbi:MAG TPA: methyltetrahydrofolate--corrinoid methyltransferase [Armatimonadetes bacterium]|nr:methyltetrahydrofolate--corrinoid methyltransferase [Armatimonadota bacterium]